MRDFAAQHIIEALRSGVPSRAVGEYFSEARPNMRNKITARLDAVRETGLSDGMIFTGSYGEGKTHMLSTVFGLATSGNMVVSLVSLGKETPVDKPYLLYKKIVAATYLPGAAQPGFRELFEQLTPGSSLYARLLAYAAHDLETDRLYYLLQALVGTGEEEERAAFLADLEGDFCTASRIQRACRRISGKPIKFNQAFSKRKHGMDYFNFLSHLFALAGYEGWVILFDEAELIGRLSKAARARSYKCLDLFLRPNSHLERTFTLAAMSSSYAEDVLSKKHDLETVHALYADDEPARAAAEATIDAILAAPELAPLTRAEILGVLEGIQRFHTAAYDWVCDVKPETIYAETEGAGHLLRTKIRTAIEFFDQLYQYGMAGRTRIGELGRERYDEDDVPDLPDDLESL